MVLILLLSFNVVLNANNLPEILATGTPYDKYNYTKYDVVLIKYSSTSNEQNFLNATKITVVDNSYEPNLNTIYKCSDFIFDQIMTDYYDNWDSTYINGDQSFLNEDFFKNGLVIFNAKSKSASTVNRYICVPHTLIKKFVKNNIILNEKNNFFAFFERYDVRRKITLKKKVLLKLKVFPVERLDLDAGENPT